MRRRLAGPLTLIAVVAATCTVSVGTARAGWAGISDIQYDNGGRVCTNGLEFSLTYFNAVTISVEISDDTDFANPIPVLPETPQAPLVFQPVPELFGVGAYLASNSYRVLFPQPVPAGHHLSVAVNFGGLHAAAGGTVDNCELGAPFTGFFGPVENPPAINTPKKADKPIKLKFGLGGNYGLSIFRDGPIAAPIPCGFPAPGTTIPPYEPTTLSGSLKYDSGESRYVYAFTPDPSWTGCYEVWFRTTVDGLTHRTLFDFG